MSTYGLDALFKPRSVAVVGGSPRERSVGRIVLRNLREGGFDGRLGVVNRRYPDIEGVATAPRLAELGWTPDLVVITAPHDQVPRAVASAAAAGARAAIVVGSAPADQREALAARLHDVSRPAGIRVVGPACLGVMAPHARLNASFAARAAAPGDLALISQSGAVAAAMVEWGAARSAGFSALAALGEGVDVDIGDLLDYFALDRHTRAILLYVESIGDARKFMSAARAAARAKPVVVVKSGRHGGTPDTSQGHVSALATPDAVHAAAFRRAGLLRVRSLDELFAAAQTLRHLRSVPGRRLAILANGGGVGALAGDKLVDLGGTLASLAPETVERLDGLLPRVWSRSNPVDISGDADGERHAQALQALLSDPGSDAVLMINVPTALASAHEVATAVARRAGGRARRSGKPVLAVWLGRDGSSRQTLEQADIPTYRNEAEAVRGFMYLVHHREGQAALMETPPSLPSDALVDVDAARAVVREALDEGREWLGPLQVPRLLRACGIDITPATLASGPEEAAIAARALLRDGQAVAVKISSPDIVHKSDVDGVRLNLVSAEAVAAAAEDILARARRLRPQARIEGVTLHPMVIRPKARELIAGIADDPTFGPVVVFGRGGTAVEMIDDTALALPPLDLRLAHEMIGRTRVSRVLAGYRDVPAADERAVALVLVKLAQLVAEVPEIRVVDINPLLADRHGAVAVDARVRVAPVPAARRGPGHPRFAIRPYPSQWERELSLKTGKRVQVRPVRPEDEAMFREFFTHVTADDLRLRFFSAVRHFSHEFIARLTQLDYARAIALAMIDPDDGRMLGAVRLLADADYDTGEYAILVRSDLKGQGIGWQLMRIMIEYAHWLELRVVEGQVLRENRTMLAMCRQLGFQVRPDPDDATMVQVTLEL